MFSLSHCWSDLVDLDANPPVSNEQLAAWQQVHNLTLPSCVCELLQQRNGGRLDDHDGLELLPLDEMQPIGSENRWAEMFSTTDNPWNQTRVPLSRVVPVMKTWSSTWFLGYPSDALNSKPELFVWDAWLDKVEGGLEAALAKRYDRDEKPCCDYDDHATLDEVLATETEKEKTRYLVVTKHQAVGRRDGKLMVYSRSVYEEHGIETNRTDAVHILNEPLDVNRCHLDKHDKHWSLDICSSDASDCVELEAYRRGVGSGWDNQRREGNRIAGFTSRSQDKVKDLQLALLGEEVVKAANEAQSAYEKKDRQEMAELIGEDMMQFMENPLKALGSLVPGVNEIASGKKVRGGLAAMMRGLLGRPKSPTKQSGPTSSRFEKVSASARPTRNTGLPDSRLEAKTGPSFHVPVRPGMRFWQLPSASQEFSEVSIGGKQPITYAGLAADGSIGASTQLMSGEVRLWKPGASAEPSATLQSPAATPADTVLSRDGQWVFQAAEGMLIRFSASTGEAMTAHAPWSPSALGGKGTLRSSFDGRRISLFARDHLWCCDIDSDDLHIQCHVLGKPMARTVLSSDGSTVWLISSSGELLKCDFVTGVVSPPLTPATGQPTIGFNISDNGLVIAWLTQERPGTSSTLHVWREAAGSVTSFKLDHGFDMVALDENGSRALLGASYGVVQLWDLEPAAPASPSMQCHTFGGLTSIGLSANGLFGFTGGGGSGLATWDFSTIRADSVHRPQPLTHRVMGMITAMREPLHTASDRQLVVRLTRDANLEIFDSQSGRRVHVVNELTKSAEFSTIQWCGEDMLLTQVNRSRRLHVQNLRTKMVLTQGASDAQGIIENVVVSPDQNWLVILGEERGAIIKSVHGLQTIGIVAQECFPRSACFVRNEDGVSLVLGGIDGSISVWSLPLCQTTRPQLRLRETKTAQSMELAQITNLIPAGGDKVLVTSATGEFTVLDIKEHRFTSPIISAHPAGILSGVICAACDPQQELIATSGSAPLVRLWSMRDWSCIGEHQLGHECASGLAFANKRLVVGNSTGAPWFVAWE